MRKVKITVESADEFETLTAWQALYMDQQTGWPRANTEVWIGSRLALRINELGCKGADLIPDVPVIGFFGDSTTFGGNGSVESWPACVRVPGCQCLNAAVEGHALDRVVARYQNLRRKVNFTAVVIGAGWHNLIYNRCDEAYWGSQFDHLAGNHVLALCTVATCLTEECRVRGVTGLMRPGDDRHGFNFWCDMPPSLEKIGEILDAVQRYNRFVAAYCAEKGHVLVDMYRLTLPACFEDIPLGFSDVCHARRLLYEPMGNLVTTALELPVAKFLRARKWRPAAAGGTVATGSAPGSAPVPGSKDAPADEDEDDPRKKMYPLW